ncbi:prolyl 3-hydroxylase sudestada1-like isoform X1 [Bradysia coprophila]|uniref:prolyl 3-hydroxylase sudestada1-like isoform X1 n=1 Tax=Bradysia coprophila TaxID=38358 RepID=UPI00187D7BD5|nr:prolyl 3-hydroxylase sudestada1-like isoform X1 [Bradysia coprophila]
MDDNNSENSTRKGQKFDVKRSLDDNGSEDAPKCKVYKMLESSSSDSSLDRVELYNDLLDEQFIHRFAKNWSENESFDSPSSVQLRTDPFQLCVIENFLQNTDHIPKLLDEMVEECEWTNKQMDLYEFHQTADLNTASSTFLKQFYAFLNTSVLPWIQQLTGLDLTHVSASCSMYNAGDHLLVHDDLLGDRKIAYVFYLSPWTAWTESMGGALELFTCNEHIQPIHPPVHKIYPKNNQFVFFKVSEKSFHQVGEVTNYNYPRITINGWFHGPSNENQSFAGRSKSPEYVIEYLPPTGIDDVVEFGWINDIYLQDNCKRNIQKHIEDKSEISLESFLKSDDYRAIQQHLIEIDECHWTHQGPAHYRNYDRILIDNVNGPVKDFYNILRSNKWFSLLYDYTELDLYGKNSRSPSVSIEFYRLTHGCYSLLNDRSGFFTDDSLDVILYFNSNPNFGFITYINPDEDGNQMDDSDDDEEDDKNSVLLTVYPKDNALNIVYRSGHTGRFIKYVSKNRFGENKYVYIMVASYKE